MLYDYDDLESQSEHEEQKRGYFKYNRSFEDWLIRKIFIAKVFTLLFFMFLTVGLMCVPALFLPGFKKWLHEHFYLVYVAFAFYLIFYCTLVCCASVRRTCPFNIIVLFLFTITMGFLLMFITSTYAVESVLMCLAITIGVSFVIIVVAAACPCDITGCGLLIMVMSIFLMIFGMVTTICIVFFNVPYIYTIYAGVAALITMFYLAYDVQMIMGGRKNEISPDEYIFAALELFMDIINLFLMILALFGRK